MEQISSQNLTNSDNIEQELLHQPHLEFTITDVLSSISLMTKQLSSVRHLTPYEAEKMVLFGANHQFPTIEDVNVSENSNICDIISELEQYNEAHQKLLLNVLESSSSPALINNSANLVPFCELSDPDSIPFIPLSKRKSYIEYLELARSINVEDITPENAPVLIKKLGTKLLSTFKV